MTSHARQLVDAASMETPLGWMLDPAMRVLSALLPCLLFVARPISANPTNFSQYDRWSSSFEVELELATRHVTSVPELEERLADVVAAALKAAAAKHFRQTSETTHDLEWGTNITTKITKLHPENDAQLVTFITLVNGAPVFGEVIHEDIELLSAAQISAALHYPFTRALSQRELSNESQNRWWIIVLVFGVGLLLVLFGWFILFVYYNSCGRPTASAFSFTKTVYVRDEETQSSPNKDSPRAAVEEERGPDTTRDTLESPPLQTTEDEQSEEKSTEKKTPQKQAGRSTNPPLPLKLPSISPSPKISKSIDSWGVEDEGKRFDFDEVKEGETGKGRSRKERPKAAGKTRPLRTAEGKIVGTVPCSTGWSEYEAADITAQKYGMLPIVSWASSSGDHPHPSQRTSQGTVQFEAKFDDDTKTSMRNVL